MFSQLTLQKESLLLFLLAPITPLTLYQYEHLCGCTLNTRELMQLKNNMLFNSQSCHVILTQGKPLCRSIGA